MLLKASGFRMKENQCGREGKKYLKSFRTMCIISWVPRCLQNINCSVHLACLTMVHGWHSLGSWNRRHGKEDI